MEKHTDGPWDVESQLLTNDGQATVMAHVDGDHFPVARVECQTKFKRGQGWKTQCPIRDANAALIAAAPDLLAACESMLATCGSSDDWKGETHESLKLIEAALAKAKRRA